MLKGDLAQTALPDVLTSLAEGSATGCLRIVDPVGEEAKLYLRGGQVYGAVVPGRRPQLGSRLVSSGALAPEALADALEAQRTELQGWRLGELLVHLGYVDQTVVEAFVHEQVLASTCDLVAWSAGTWRFRPNEKTREDVAPPLDVPTLLAAVAHRTATWASMVEVVDGPDAVPVLSASGGGSSEMAVGADAWSLLCKVDGVRTVAELARDCGFTLYEAGQTVVELVEAGLVEVEAAEAEPEPEAPTASFLPASLASRLTAAFAPAAEPVDEPAPVDVAALITSALREPAADPLDQVSSALSAALGPAPSDEGAFVVPARRTRALTPEQEQAAAAREEKASRDRARRARDAAELAAAQAELEADRLAAAQASEEALGEDHVAPVVDLATARREAARVEGERLAAEVAAAEAAEAAAAEAAAAAAAAEAARVDAERVAAETAERVAAEAAAAEAAAAEAAAAEAAAAEASRLEAERLAAEAAQAEVERRAAEEATRVEAERVAAEQAAAEAARAEAERLAAEAAR
ncbi:MAG: hypothetical protein JWO60_794, partial [Frankiales bacterium]|nr:hypothetical protein [Frankiales bacterium]